MELTNRQTELRRHLMQLTQQLANGDRDRAIATVTLEELARLPPETRTYRAVGKMYVLQDKQKIQQDIAAAAADSAKADQDRLLLRGQFVKKLKESEAQSEELATTITKMVGKK